MIPISKIIISQDEERAVLEVLRSGNLVQGEKVLEFEKEFAEYIGAKFPVAVSNGTTALHLALLSLGLGTGDEVITTPFSFIASTNAILYVGAKPVFVDIKEDFNIDASKIEEKITKNTKAILPVHLFGNPCDMDIIMDTARKFSLKVIEDAAQAHGAEFNGKKVGSFGDYGCFSFYATKNMTTGEGGMIVTEDKDLYEKLKMLRSHGSSKRYYHDFLGFNFRMTDIQAAIGIEQLKKLDEFNSKRIENALYLNGKLKNIKGIVFPKIDKNKKHVFHQYTIIVTSDFPLNREDLRTSLKERGIECAVYYPLPIHKQESMNALGDLNLPVCEKLSQQVISLPIGPSLKAEDLDYIVEVLTAISNGQ